MENYTWTTGFLTLELLPDGTIHMENTSINGDTDEEELIFDKINKIIIHEDDDILALEADGCGYDFPQLGAKFLAETKGRFPISEPTPYPEIKMVIGEWTDNGKPINVFTIFEDKVERVQATPGGDILVETTLF